MVANGLFLGGKNYRLVIKKRKGRLFLQTTTTPLNKIGEVELIGVKKA